MTRTISPLSTGWPITMQSLAVSCPKQAHYALQTEGLQNALAQLDDRSRRIVESRWLQDDGGLTLHELAAEYGVSAERIRQIEAKAMRKTARFLAEEAEAV